jgi:hypothetical protein
MNLNIKDNMKDIIIILTISIVLGIIVDKLWKP